MAMDCSSPSLAHLLNSNPCHKFQGLGLGLGCHISSSKAACKHHTNAHSKSAKVGPCVSMDAASQSLIGRRNLIIGTPLSLFLFATNKSEATEVDVDLQKIQEELRKVISKSKAAGILRLVFHDAGTFNLKSNSGGMNGSILLELERPENTGLKRSVKILEKAKVNLDPVLQVSWADLIAIAGSEAVAICDGPRIPVKRGRLDSSLPDPEGQLPEENLDAVALKEIFQNKGFLTQELVVLSGAHTLGSKGFGSPTVFDNSYFRTLLRKPWLGSEKDMTTMVGLPSDRALVEDSECKKWLEIYANNQGAFFNDFAAAYLKLINAGATWKSINL